MESLSPCWATYKEIVIIRFKQKFLFVPFFFSFHWARLRRVWLHLLCSPHQVFTHFGKTHLSLLKTEEYQLLQPLIVKQILQSLLHSPFAALTSVCPCLSAAEGGLQLVPHQWWAVTSAQACWQCSPRKLWPSLLQWHIVGSHSTCPPGPSPRSIMCGKLSGWIVRNNEEKRIV